LTYDIAIFMSLAALIGFVILTIMLIGLSDSRNKKDLNYDTQIESMQREMYIQAARYKHLEQELVEVLSMAKTNERHTRQIMEHLRDDNH